MNAKHLAGFLLPVWVLVGMICTTLSAYPTTDMLHPGPYPRPSYGGYYGNDNYPYAEVRAIPQAATNRILAQEQYWQARKDLDYAIARSRYNFEKSANTSTAIHEENQAWQAYQQAQQRALEQLRNDPEYVAAVQLKQEMALRISNLRNTPPVDPKTLLALATAKMDYATIATNRERIALSNNPAVQQARHRLVTAGTRLSELRQQFQDQVRYDDQQLAQLRQAVDDARTNWLASNVYLHSSREARDIALYYGYLSYRWGPFQGFSPYVLLNRWWW